MSFIKTESISIFPLAKNRPSDRGARLFYEDNVANIIRQMIDTQGFIINPDQESSANFIRFGSLSGDNKITLYIERPLTFNLGGYYFNIGEEYSPVTIFDQEPLTQEQVDNGFQVWARIELDVVNKEIIGQDDKEDGVYQGLVFSTASTSDAFHYNIKIADCWFEDDSFNSQLATDSYIKVDNGSLNVKRIDGKHD